MLRRCDLLKKDSGLPAADGDQNLLAVMANGVQLDIFFAHDDLPLRDLFGNSFIPCNWGTLMVCRTGSREHNIYICQCAARLGLSWDPYRGVKKGDKIIASATEESVLRAVGLPFIHPEDRER